MASIRRNPVNRFRRRACWRPDYAWVLLTERKCILQPHFGQFNASIAVAARLFESDADIDATRIHQSHQYQRSRVERRHSFPTLSKLRPLSGIRRNLSLVPSYRLLPQKTKNHCPPRTKRTWEVEGLKVVGVNIATVEDYAPRAGSNGWHYGDEDQTYEAGVFGNAVLLMAGLKQARSTILASSFLLGRRQSL